METLTKFKVKVIGWADRTFVVKKAKVSMDKLPAFFSESYSGLYKAVNKLGAQVSGPPCAIYYTIDALRKETELAAAVPVQGITTAPEGFELVRIPKSKALMLTYYGPYEGMTPAYAALEEHLKKDGLKKEWMIEEYFADPAMEKDSAKWKTNIYFIVS